jgi:RNA polymerase sigma-70 factor, ECF subfamily
VETSPLEVSQAVASSSTSFAQFRGLFEAEFGYVCRSLRRLGVREGDLEDVAQELFITVYSNLGTFDPARPLRPWLLSFALRFAANYRRLARHRGHVGEETLDRERSSSDANAEARDLVLRALGTLDFDRRVALVMHDLEGWGAPEIAASIGVPLNTVYSRLRVARADFRSAIDSIQRQGGGT